MGSVSLLVVLLASAGEHVVTARMHHLCAEGKREWAEFAEKAEGPALRLTFAAKANGEEWNLRLRQRDVKEVWRVLLNGKELGRLVQDENAMAVRFVVPKGAVREGENRLSIEQLGKTVDDIEVGDVVLEERSKQAALTEATLDVEVVDGVSERPLPCRVTIVDEAGSLAALGISSDLGLAVRPGVVYTATGKAKIGLAAGEYAVTAGRGFEYGIETVKVRLKAGEVLRKRLAIRREVKLEGWICCDTHVHTLTGSGHGDATLDERMVTLAGEGIDLAIATEHNRQDDWRAAAKRQGVENWFTTMVGNEVTTTSLGHFNVFPLPVGGPLPDHQLKDCAKLFGSIKSVAGDDAVVVLNHARDVHGGFAPFGVKRHVSVAGEDLEGWRLGANAMEVVNSGAQRNEPMDLVRDWMGMLNVGAMLTPIGASDSHDVARYIVGQGRTYIRYGGERGGAINAAKAVKSLREGRVSIGCGLLATIEVNGAGSGELVGRRKLQPNHVVISLKVLGPSWTKLDRVELYANGIKVREEDVQNRKMGMDWVGGLMLPAPKHDTWYAVVASGPGVKEMYWPIAKPYQPTSTVVEPRVMAVTGAVWFDADGDGKRTCAAEYARRVAESNGFDVGKMMKALEEYDEAVAVQAAALMRRRGVSPFEMVRRAEGAGEQVVRGLRTYADGWRESEVARGK